MTNNSFPCPGDAPVTLAWKLKTQTLRFSRHPLLMGILNVTSDSFSDGGQFLEPLKAIDHALRMEDAGADILDIGGESTRPYAEPVSLAEELQRVMPVIKALAKRTSIPLSIDTSKAEVARQAIDAGVEIINDISGLQGDPDMIQVAVDAKAGVCAMHMQGIPQTMQDSPTYGNLIDDILLYLQTRREQLVAAGVNREHICLDPGIGFGKTISTTLPYWPTAGDSTNWDAHF